MDKVTVLFPGAFKPMHAGHIDLIRRYLKEPNVKEIKIFISQSDREEIDQVKAMLVAQTLLAHISGNITIDVVLEPTPITAAYKFMAKAEPGIYAMTASSKEPENMKRIKKFVENHISGKYLLLEGVSVIEMPVNIEPLLYSGRSDDNNGKPISGTILRQDLRNDDLENFKTNYPGCNKNEIIDIWYILKVKLGV